MNQRIQTALRLMAAVGAIAAPALFAQMALAQNAQAQASYQAASTLPPPPYTVNDRQPIYGGHQTYDRYGGGTTHPRVQAAPSAQVYQGPRLSWSGKADAAAPAQRAPYGQAAYAAAQPSAQAVAHGWTFVPPIGAPAQNPAQNSAFARNRSPGIAAYTPPAAPTSIYDPVSPSVQATVKQQTQAIQAQNIEAGGPNMAANQAQSPADGARRYSVSREFGGTPDPIPLPPQFFGPTADLTTPETPDPQRRTVGTDGKAKNALQPTDGQ